MYWFTEPPSTVSGIFEKFDSFNWPLLDSASKIAIAMSLQAVYRACLHGEIEKKIHWTDMLLGSNFSVYLTKQRDENYVHINELEMIQLS